MPVTQNDIANHLGLSRPYVSRALRDDPVVPMVVRQRVRHAANELGYSEHSNLAARALIARRHGRVLRQGVIGCAGFTATTEGSYWSQLVQGLHEGDVEHEYELLLLRSEAPGWEKIDALITHGEWGASMARTRPPGMAAVLIGVTEGETSSVVADQFQAGYLATRHLLILGHRRIGTLMWNETAVAQKRLEGYRAALLEAGLQPDARWVTPLIFIEGDPLSHVHNITGWLATQRELGLTALLAQSDHWALQVINILHAHGVRVPQEISVLGFDSTAESARSRPSLTSVAIDQVAMGRLSMRLLLNELNSESCNVGAGAPPASRLILPVHLDVRQSSGPPPTPVF